MTGCSSRGPQTESPERSEAVRQIQSLLDSRAAALKNRDTDAYLAAISSEARSFEETLEAGARTVPAGDFSFSLVESSVRSNSFPVDGVQVVLSYRYDGLPEDNVFRIPLVYRIDRQGSDLSITDSALGAGTLPIWAVRPVSVTSSDHLLVLSAEGTGAPADIMRVAEQARSEVQEALPFDVDPRFLVVLAQNEAEYHRYLPPAGPVAGPRVAQANTSYQATPQDFRVEGRHIIVNLESLARDRTTLQTFKHELAHLALARFTTPATPAWVAESAAMHLAGQKTNWTQRVATGNFEDLSFAELSRTRSLGEQDPSGQSAALQYSYAAGAAGYLVETFGAGRYWDFYRSYAEVPAQVLYRSLPSDPNAGEEQLADLAGRTTDQALRDHFDLTTAELDIAVRGWLANNA
ncbi:MAG TPA: hypothetical protein VHI31_08935 [Actinomycetota bacterium]|nr:hypothetical protein [Actinomycetota bacterium]